MSGTNRWKLFGMMVLEFFIWGAWLPLVFPYMGSIGFDANQQALVGSAFAIASLVGIFFSNQFADRNFSAERFMAVSHFIGGVSMLGLYFTRDFWPFFSLMLIHALVYVPTISVSNSLAFANLKDPAQEFGIVRMGGTIGWILASWPLYFILKGAEGEALIRAQSSIFLVAGASSIVLAGFSLLLPHTPPKPASGAENLAWLKATKALFAAPAILVLFFVTFVDATIHNGYFVMAGGFLHDIGVKPEYIMPVMSIGQIAEILTMAVLGLFLKQFGWRTTMTLGILGHAVRFGVFAFMPNNVPVVVAVQVLHGICYAFFFATAYIFIDEAFPKDVRSSAQGLLNALILGAGDLAAKWIFIPLQASMTQETEVAGVMTKVVDYRSLFLVPTLMAVGAAFLLLIFFHPKSRGPSEGDKASSPAH